MRVDDIMIIITDYYKQRSRDKAAATTGKSTGVNN